MKIKKIIICIISIITFFSCINVKLNKAYAQDSTSEIVMDVKTNRILCGNNIHEKKYMASTTKILTAIVAIENCNLEEKVTITEKSIGVEGSSIYLEKGEILSVKDLLYGLMLRSGNDCAETLALHVSKSIENFAVLMNEKAKEIGCLNSNFVNPHGLHNDNHYTTAYDLALISCYAIKNPIFKEISSTKSIRIPFTTRNTVRLLINKNKMLNSYDGATGIKTGYTKKAGRCLVTSAEKNGVELVSVVLNCSPMWEKSKELLNSRFDTLKNIKIIESDHILDFIPIKNKDEKIAIHVKNDVCLSLTDNEYKQLKIEYNYPKELDNSISNEENIGEIRFLLKNNLIFTEKIYTIL